MSKAEETARIGRCEYCKHWDRKHRIKDHVRDCSMLNYDESLIDIKVESPDDISSCLVISTNKNFGCAYFENKYEKGCAK